MFLLTVTDWTALIIIAFADLSDTVFSSSGEQNVLKTDKTSKKVLSSCPVITVDYTEASGGVENKRH